MKISDIKSLENLLDKLNDSYPMRRANPEYDPDFTNADEEHLRRVKENIHVIAETLLDWKLALGSNGARMIRLLQTKFRDLPIDSTEITYQATETSVMFTIPTSILGLNLSRPAANGYTPVNQAHADFWENYIQEFYEIRHNRLPARQQWVTQINELDQSFQINEVRGWGQGLRIEISFKKNVFNERLCDNLMRDVVRILSTYLTNIREQVARVE